MKEKSKRPASGRRNDIDDAIYEAKDARHISEWEKETRGLSQSLYESHEGLRTDHLFREAFQRRK